MTKKVVITYTLATLLFLSAGCGKGNADSSGQTKAENTAAESTGELNIPITATDEDYCTILFSYIENDTEGLYSIGSNGKDLKKLVSARVKSPARVSPRGRRLTFNSHSRELKEDVQAVYDLERDTLILLKQPDGGVGWYPRWWDEDHIYYRSTGFIYKQNIHTGEYQKITKERLRKWLDPIWVPELKKFVNVEKRFIATFNMDGSGYSGDTLNIDHNTEYNTGYSPFLVSFNKKYLVGFQTTWNWIKEGETPPPIKFVLVDLNGGVHYEVEKVKNSPPINTTCDPQGNWIYYVEYFGGELGNSYKMLKRKRFSEHGSEQLIYIKKGAVIAYLSTHRKNMHE